MYCTTLNSYTGDSRAAFNILSLHQNRYLIYCRQLQILSSHILLVLVIFLRNREDVSIYSTVVGTLQFWLTIIKRNVNPLNYMISKIIMQFRLCPVFAFIFYIILCKISNMIESLVFSKIILIDLHSW